MNRIRHLLTIVTVGLAVLALASPASADWWRGSRAEAEDWPQRFRDSRHQASTLVDPNIDVGDVNPLKVDWSVTDPGPRVADAETSPIVVGDAVYVGGKSITRYDRGSGDIVWRTPLGDAPDGLGVSTSLAYGRGVIVATEYGPSRSFISDDVATVGSASFASSLVVSPIDSGARVAPSIALESEA